MLANYFRKKSQEMQFEADKAARDMALEIFVGRVTSVADRHLSTSVTTSRNTTITVNTVPEIWVVGERGQERKFSDAVVAECRLGYEVAIALDRSNDAVLAMQNRNTGQTWFAHKLSIQQTDGRYFVGMIATVVVLLMVSLLVSLLFFGDSIGSRPWWADIGSNLLPISAVALGVWISDHGRRRHNFWTHALQQRIRTSIAQ